MNINDLEKYYSRKPIIKKNNGKFVTTKNHGTFLTNYKSIKSKNDYFTQFILRDQDFKLRNFLIKHAPSIEFKNGK